LLSEEAADFGRLFFCGEVLPALVAGRRASVYFGVPVCVGDVCDQRVERDFVGGIVTAVLHVLFM